MAVGRAGVAPASLGFPSLFFLVSCRSPRAYDANASCVLGWRAGGGKREGGGEEVLVREYFFFVSVRCANE